MPTYQTRSHADLLSLARERSWVDGADCRETRIDVLPPVAYAGVAGSGQLPAGEACHEPGACMRIPHAIVHGGNFSLLIDDMIFPGGFAHSYAHSPAWRPTPQGVVNYTPQPTDALLAGAPASLLGILSHWGHFFVDALDRLLALDRLGHMGDRMLVADPDFFYMNPVVDDCHAVPQVSQLMTRLGLALRPEQVQAVRRNQDYRVSNLYLCSLNSVKPAISADSFRSVRQRLMDRGLRAGGDELIFVGRADIRKRFVLNQQAVVDHLASVHQAATVYPKHLSVDQAIDTFAGASDIILPVGSAKFNLLFCHPGTRVVVPVPRGYAAGNGGIVLVVRHLCQALGLKLAFYETDIVERGQLVNSDMVITPKDIDLIVALLDRLA